MNPEEIKRRMDKIDEIYMDYIKTTRELRKKQKEMILKIVKKREEGEIEKIRDLIKKHAE
jgi:hypothetical protein